ncbi:MAG: SMC-Scp complex subunit ScpB [Verrucomicrobia bacterium]|nr:SMC-Scp complex subunit ScpB [Verrucomicrobiota bacterium]
MSPFSLAQIIEALLFASPKALSVAELRAALRAAVSAELSEDPASVEWAASREPEILLALGELAERYRAGGHAMALTETSAGWQLATRPELAPWVRALHPDSNRPPRLSAPALETLSLVAYRQPVTRAGIEAVRGVDVGGVLQTLLDRGLVRIAGRDLTVPGRPLLYATTEFFLEHFGLKTLDELPNNAELRTAPLASAAAADAGSSKLEARSSKQSESKN